ncbi:MAG: 3-phosphoshikimate 1-carboxyvinyltransferase, partial [Candidatus Rifleibacteriota bacterium]
KTAILLAATRANGLTTIDEPLQSRDHSEILLRKLGAEITTEAGRITIKGPFVSNGDFSFKVPGDISSAAFVIVAAMLLPGSKVEISNVLLNPGRTAFLNKLRQMGARLNWEVESSEFELAGTIKVAYSPNLKAIDIQSHEVPGLIDELPVLAAAMAFADGVSSVRGATELRVKESDRISSICSLLKNIGVTAEELDDGFYITGPARIKNCFAVNPGGDHRIAATMAVLAMASNQGLLITDHECIKISFPDFSQIFLELFQPK